MGTPNTFRPLMRNHLDTFKLDPALDNLRSDPRYAALRAGSGYRRNNNIPILKQAKAEYAVLQ